MNITKVHVDLPEDFELQVFESILEPDADPGYLNYHWHDSLEITYVKSGRIRYFVNDHIYEMNPGDVIIFNNIEPHAWQVLGDEPTIQPVLHFNPVIIWSGEMNSFDYQYMKPFLERSTNFSNKLPHEHPVTKEIFRLLLDIEKENRDKQIGYKLMIKTRLLGIMTFLIRHFQDAGKLQEYPQDKKQKLERLQTVLTFIKQNFCDRIYLKDAAAEAFMNPNYFSGFFKETMGITFVDYILKLRMEKAVEMIQQSDYSIVKIAIDCGFDNMSHFYRTYKKLYDGSPAALRKAGRYLHA